MAKSSKAKAVKSSDPVKLKKAKAKVDPKQADDEVEIDLEFIGSKEETAESRTIQSRKRLRAQMDSDVEAFLEQGGQIEQVDPNVMADPPRKPVSNYGSRPI